MADIWKIFHNILVDKLISEIHSRLSPLKFLENLWVFMNSGEIDAHKSLKLPCFRKDS